MDKEPERNELLDTWETRKFIRDKRIQMQKAGHTSKEKKLTFERCVLCGGYDFTFPLSFMFCDNCYEGARGYLKESIFSAQKTITMKPCFVCAKSNTLLRRANAHICSKCVGKIAKNVKKV